MKFKQKFKKTCLSRDLKDHELNITISNDARSNDVKKCSNSWSGKSQDKSFFFNFQLNFIFHSYKTCAANCDRDNISRIFTMTWYRKLPRLNVLDFVLEINFLVTIYNYVTNSRMFKNCHRKINWNIIFFTLL